MVTWKKMGMPQANIAMKYINRNVPEKENQAWVDL